MKKGIKVFLVFLTILLGATFVFSGYSKLYPIELFEFNFVDLGIANWTVAPIIARLLIAMEFVLGLLLILNFELRRVTFRATIGLLTFFTVYLMVAIIKDGNKGNCGCFGTYLQMTPLQSILKNIGLIALTIVLYKFHEGYNWKRKKIVWLLSLSVSIVLPFILNPISLEASSHFDDGAKNFHLPLESLYNDSKNEAPPIDLKKGKHVIAFLSLTCPHCKIAAFKLQILKKQHPEWSIYFIFNGETSDIQKFHADTRSENIPFSMFLGETFVKLSGPYLPAIYLVENSIVKKKYTYLTIDEKELATYLKK